MKKIILAVLIAILLLLIYIGILWIMSIDSIVDKDGMIYEEDNKNIVNQNIELQERISTVVETAILVNDSLDLFIQKLQDEAKSDDYLNSLKDQDNYEEIKQALIPNDSNMIVTPKEIDDLIENMKDVVARGINFAV